MLSTKTSFLPGKRDRNFSEGLATCSVCYEEKKIDESVTHKNSEEKILHAVFCSLECVKQFVIHARESQQKISCPICRDEVYSLDNNPILRSCDVEYLKDQISIALLRDDFHKAEAIRSILTAQFCDNYLDIEKIAPEAFQKNQLTVIEYLFDSLQKLQTTPVDWLLFAMMSQGFSKNQELQKQFWQRSLNYFSQHVDVLQDKQKCEDVFREAFVDYNKLCALRNVELDYNAKIFVNFLKTFPENTIEVDAEIFHLVTADCLKRQDSDDFVEFVKLCQKDLSLLIFQDNQSEYNGIDTILIQDAINSLMVCATALRKPALISFLIETFEYSQSDFEHFISLEKGKGLSDEITLKHIEIFEQKIIDSSSCR